MGDMDRPLGMARAVRGSARSPAAAVDTARGVAVEGNEYLDARK